MKIANPIFDVVFKYLMNDNKIAKLMLSVILDKKIISLEFEPTEEDDEKIKGISTYRLDFAALIEDENGNKEKALIEIQKAQNIDDIMRFRRYLGNQYKDENNSYKIKQNNRLVKKAIPIITIYFLGYKFSTITSPLIKVNRDYIDISTNEKIDIKEEFIESLTHNSYIIQIPYLKGKRRTELEQLLSVFDQGLEKTNNNKEIIIDEDSYPEKFQIVIKRLLKANSEPRVRRLMDRESEIIEKFDDYENTIKEAKQKEKEAKQKLIKTKQETKQKLTKTKQEAEQKLIKTKQEAKQKLISSAKQMIKLGMPINEVENITGLSINEIK